MNLTQTQKEYFEKIKNSEIKTSLERSYFFDSMEEEEKLDFLIWLSFIHEDTEAERAFLESLKEETDLIDESFEDPAMYTLSKEDEKKQLIVVAKEAKVLDSKANAIDAAIQKEIAKPALKGDNY